MEHILYRIICDELYYKIGKKRLVIKYPSIKVRYRSCEIYELIYKRALKVGLMQSKDIKQFLYPNGLLTKEDDDILDIAPKHIDHFKKDLYFNNGNSTKVEQIKKYLETAKKSYHASLCKLHAYDYVTAEGIASYARWQYCIQQSVFYKGKKWDWSESSPADLLNYYYKNLIDDEIIRKISHTSPFDTMWSTGKPFRGSSTNITLDQQKLIGWAKLYDSIYKSGEPPPKRVIEDDDMLDGWLIVQREKREEENKKSRANEILGNSKIANADEVFIMPNLLDPSEVQSLNSPFAKNIIKRRLDEATRAGGEIKEQDLSDIKRNIGMQQTQLLRQRHA